MRLVGSEKCARQSSKDFALANVALVSWRAAARLAVLASYSMALYVPDFEKYYRSELHSDVAIILREVGSTGGCSELPDENDIHAELPGHTMVLVGNSPLWKAQVGVRGHTLTKDSAQHSSANSNTTDSSA